jgi:hypothetical protein
VLAAAIRSRIKVAVLITGALGFGFLAGVLFQKYYTVDRLLRDLGLRSELTYQLHGRKPVARPLPDPGRLMVALVFGQSNSSNFANARSASKKATYNFFSGDLYTARDPMIGANGMGGSVWPLLGDSLQDNGLYDTVVFATIGVASSSIVRWAPGGDLHPRLLDTIDELSEADLPITHLLWHQGETDAQLGTTPEAYIRAFHSMLQSIRERGVEAPVYVSLATRCYEIDRAEALRGAQKALRDPLQGILPGPDTDALGPEYRYDGCHFSAKGVVAAAGLWLRALSDQRRKASH